jgi:NADP-dependent 3-hydroxy acid dehydrogenase YdfG
MAKRGAPPAYRTAVVHGSSGARRCIQAVKLDGGGQHASNNEMHSPAADRRIHRVAGHLCAGPSPTVPPAMCVASGSAAAGGIVAVTGCTSGLGLNLCLEFMRRGFTVAGCGRRQELIDELNAEHGAGGHRFYVADSSNADSVSAWSEAVRSDLGCPDVLVNNAGLGGAGKLPWKMDDERFGQVIDTNVKGVFYGCKYFVQAMLDDLVDRPERAVIKRVINISSGVGHSTSPVQADYSASKWGVEVRRTHEQDPAPPHSAYHSA